jgi:hypothetical protein
LKYLKQGGYGAKIDRKGPNRQNRPKCVNRAPVGMHVRRWVYMLIEFTCPSGLPALADAQSRWNQPGGVRRSIFASPGRYRDGASIETRLCVLACVDVVGDIPPEYRDPGQDLQERPAPTLHTHTDYSRPKGAAKGEVRKERASVRSNARAAGGSATMRRQPSGRRLTADTMTGDVESATVCNRRPRSRHRLL